MLHHGPCRSFLWSPGRLRGGCWGLRAVIGEGEFGQSDQVPECGPKGQHCPGISILFEQRHECRWSLGCRLLGLVG
jgi:hypothetical protein